MFIEGQTVTLNGKDYVISKTEFVERHKACSLCQQVNTRTPCVERFDYPTQEGAFSLRNCMDNMPEGCIPKIKKTWQ